MFWIDHKRSVARERTDKTFTKATLPRAARSKVQGLRPQRAVGS